MTKWEYYIYVDTTTGEDHLQVYYNQLNMLGNEGWELVTTIYNGGWVIFKRPVS